MNEKNIKLSWKQSDISMLYIEKGKTKQNKEKEMFEFDKSGDRD